MISMKSVQFSIHIIIIIFLVGIEKKYGEFYFFLKYNCLKNRERERERDQIATKTSVIQYILCNLLTNVNNQSYKVLVRLYL